MFDKQSVIVTGAASGIGRATALHLGSLGARVIVADVLPEAGAATVDAVADAGGEACSVVCDVTDPGSVEQAFAQAADAYGGLDLAVNNAGIGHQPGDLHEMSVADFDRVVCVDLRGTFLCMRAELSIMTAAGHGTIVNMASNAGVKDAPGMAAYTAAKHGVVGLTKNAALQCARRNIRVNAICPGTILTPGLASFPEENQREWADLVPMSRLGTPEEMAAGIAFLLSDQSSFITGAALLADGGIMFN